MSIRTKQIVLPIAVILITLVGIGAMMAGKKPPEKKPPERRVPVVSTTQIELTPVTLDVRSQGLVTPRYSTNLVAQVSGEILSLNPDFMRGNIIRKGTLLAQIDPFNYEVKVQQAKASLASARAAFILERAQGQVAEAEWAKITSAEPSELGLRKPQQEQALAGVKAAEAALKQAEKDLQRTRIVAPYDAIVQARTVSPGAFVNTGSPIGSLADVSMAEIRLPINQDDFSYLNNGGLDATVLLTAELGGRDRIWQANITRNEGVIDDQTRMTYLIATVNDPYGIQNGVDHVLPFGSFVSATLEGTALPQAARIPRAVLQGNRVPLIKDSKLAFSEVDVARHEGKFSIVRAGLDEGDQLVITPLDHPIEGMPLQLSEDSEPLPSVAENVQ